MKSMILKLVCVHAFVLLGAGVARAQQFDINWHSIACGGGIWSADTTDTWELSGTIGEPIATASAAPLSGGEWSLVGGFLSLPVPQPCPTDLDSDGDVDLADLAALLANFGTSSGATFQQGDLDADGDIDLVDLTILLSNFGVTCS